MGSKWQSNAGRTERSATSRETWPNIHQQQLVSIELHLCCNSAVVLCGAILTDEIAGQGATIQHFERQNVPGSARHELQAAIHAYDSEESVPFVAQT